MFGTSLGHNPNLVGFNSDLNSSLEGFDPFSLAATQNSGSFSLRYFEAASIGSSQSLDGTNGSDPVLRGSADSDLLIGGTGNDTLYGLSGNDVLFGYDGDDLIKGGTGNDLLVGWEGNDILLDGDGGDYMIGGEGADQFWLGSWDVPDTASIITDFEVGTDTIKVGRLGVTFNDLTIQNTEVGAIISEQGQALAVVLGANSSSLQANSFIFGNPELAQQFQATLNLGVHATGVPGATQAFITPDGFTWKGAAGVSNLETQTPMQPDDIQGIASITKTFTAATVLKLVEQGTLSLDDTLGKWLPDIAQNIPDGVSDGVPDGEDITLRQLLNGTAGIFNFDEDEQYQADFSQDPSRVFTPEELVAYTYDNPRFSTRVRQPSPGWTYPNTNNILAGLIVEKATGSSFSSVMREEVLDPLGLDHTFFGGKEQIVGNLAHGYGDVFNEDGILFQEDGVIDNATDVAKSQQFSFWAAGALYSNAEDVARFSDALFSGELLSANSLNEMLTFVEAANYGLGVDRNELPAYGTVLSKGGDVAGYASEMYYFPDLGGATSVALTNLLRLNARQIADPPKSLVFMSASTLLLNSPTVA
jgi:D-alanyl-D-alanine carboxypeptidase